VPRNLWPPRRGTGERRGQIKKKCFLPHSKGKPQKTSFRHAASGAVSTPDRPEKVPSRPGVYLAAGVVTGRQSAPRSRQNIRPHDRHCWTAGSTNLTDAHNSAKMDQICLTARRSKAVSKRWAATQHGNHALPLFVLVPNEIHAWPQSTAKSFGGVTIGMAKACWRLNDRGDLTASGETSEGLASLSATLTPARVDHRRSDQ